MLLSVHSLLSSTPVNVDDVCISVIDLYEITKFSMMDVNTALYVNCFLRSFSEGNFKLQVRPKDYLKVISGIIQAYSVISSGPWRQVAALQWSLSCTRTGRLTHIGVCTYST